jgi:hypothetical protein
MRDAFFFFKVRGHSSRSYHFVGKSCRQAVWMNPVKIDEDTGVALASSFCICKWFHIFIHPVVFNSSKSENSFALSQMCSLTTQKGQKYKNKMGEYISVYSCSV